MVIEFHDHEVCQDPRGYGFYCKFVYLDGRQCDVRWVVRPLILVAQESRVLTREAIKAWSKAEGPM